MLFASPNSRTLRIGLKNSFMNFKDIFRPTRRRIAWSFVACVSLSFAGVYALGLSAHGPSFLAYIVDGLLLPSYILREVAIDLTIFATHPKSKSGILLIFALTQYLYYYAVMAIILECPKASKSS